MRNWFTALALVSVLAIAGPASGMEAASFDDLDANRDGKRAPARRATRPPQQFQRARRGASGGSR